MWISVPTPVMRSTNSPDSWSNVNDMSTWNVPASIQVNSLVVCERSSPSLPSSCTNRIAPRTNEAEDAKVPMRWPKRSASLPHTRSSPPLASGMAISNHWRSNIRALLQLQEARLVDRGRATRAVDGHDDGQADDDLGGRNDHDEERRDLPVEVAVLAGEAHEREVGRVEHELDAHEHDDRVAAYEHPDGTDREQDERERDVLVHFSPPKDSVEPSSSSCSTTLSMSSSKPSRS